MHSIAFSLISLTTKVNTTFFLIKYLQGPAVVVSNRTATIKRQTASSAMDEVSVTHSSYVINFILFGNSSNTMLLVSNTNVETFTQDDANQHSSFFANRVALKRPATSTVDSDEDMTLEVEEEQPLRYSGVLKNFISKTISRDTQVVKRPKFSTTTMPQVAMTKIRTTSAGNLIFVTFCGRSSVLEISVLVAW